jgi:hypothetical protein
MKLKDQILQDIHRHKEITGSDVSEVAIVAWYGRIFGEEAVIQALGELVDEGSVGYHDNQYTIKGCEDGECKL